MKKQTHQSDFFFQTAINFTEKTFMKSKVN